MKFLATARTGLRLSRLTACFCAGFLVFAALSFRPAGAQEAACSPAIWEAMSAKAWLEAQTENVTNQNLITKPDSVLEYSCFDFHLSFVRDFTGPVFTESQSYGPMPNHDPDSLDRALEFALVGNLIFYLFGNHSPTYLGDRSTTAEINASIINFCSSMRAVWGRAKCANFLEAEHDGFFSYDQHNAFEVRQLPLPCDVPPEWQTYIDLAITDPPWWASYIPPTVDVYVLVDFLLDPSVCGEPRSPAHVNVRTYPEGQFEDAVCTNPGCIYDGEACVPL
jgi:hypothetical protein